MATRTPGGRGEPDAHGRAVESREVIDQPVPAGDEGRADTLARMFWRRVGLSWDRPAQLVKHGAAWRALSWGEVGDIVRQVAVGLLALGHRQGEPVALLSRSRAEWVQADFGILSAGGVTVPIYPTYTAEQIAFQVNDAGARILLVEDPGQLEKVLEARRSMACLEHVIVLDGWAGHPSALAWEKLVWLGREHARRLGSELAHRLYAVGPEHTATIVYTSGTTGPPKGVVQTHGNHMAALRAVGAIAPVGPGDVHLLFLPLAHSLARLEAFMGVSEGLTTAFAESLERLGANLRQVRPHFIVGVPRVFEKVHERVVSQVLEASAPRRRLFTWAVAVGQAASRRAQLGRPCPPALRLAHALARRLAFSSLHRALGGRLRFAVSGGAPLPPEIAEFFHAAGILILEGYGLTESCPIVAFNRMDRFRFGSVGPAVPGVEVRIAPDGEVLARGPNVATRGYLGRPEATAEAFDAEGWLHTGDIGRVDAQGFLYITDRKKDIIVTSGGINLAPQRIEALLRKDAFIEEAMVYGDRRPYPVALISVAPGPLAALAAGSGLSAHDHAALAGHPAVVEHVGRIVERANASLPSYARIKRFAVIPVPLSELGGELTPTQKLRRKVVAAKYDDLLQSLYRAA